MTNYEKETIINFNEDEKTADIFTYNKKMINRLLKLCEQFPELFKEKINTNNDGSKTFEIPKKYVSIRTPRFLTEEQKEVIKDRFLKIKK